MGRSSIGRLMVVVAFLAANFAALRFLIASFDTEGNLVAALLVGLLPLLDAQVVALYLVAVRYRVAVRWRARGERGRLGPAFAAACSPVLLVALAAVLGAPGPIHDGLNRALGPVDDFLRACGVVAYYNSPFERLVVIPAVLGLALSGPPLLLALALAWAFSRVEVVVTPRP